MKCVCGAENFDQYDGPGFLVDENGALALSPLSLARCSSCGIVRQVVERTHEAQVDYYKKYPPTSEFYRAKDYAHDRSVAAVRFAAYKIPASSSLLDVGSGSGAFVDECRCAGVSAFGCEIAQYAYAKSFEHIYRKDFLSVHFPTDEFDFVTCHDVLEHTVDPVGFLSEVFRVLKQEGVFYLDFPRYFGGFGDHHWKCDEHIWFFDERQLSDLLCRVGFKVVSCAHPIASKILVVAQKPSQHRKTILVPPGIGDSFWSLTKMQALIKREGIGLPDVSLVCPRTRGHDGHLRSVPFLRLFPFLNHTGEVVSNQSQIDGLKAVWREAYATKGRTLFRGVLGYDFFLSYNGWMSYGYPLEELDPELHTNWYPPMFRSLGQDAYMQQCLSEYGKYIAFYFPLCGTYAYWSAQFSARSVSSYIKRVVQRTGCRPVFVGSIWDHQDQNVRALIDSVDDRVDLTGETGIEQLFGLLRGASLVAGYPSGLPIMATVLGSNVHMIWNSYYHRDFYRYACPPDSFDRNYFIDDTDSIDIEYLTNRSVSIVEGHPIKGRPIKPGQHETEMSWHPKRGKRLTRRQRSRASLWSAEGKEDRGRVYFTSDVSSMAVACVCKTGGDFTADCVHRLVSALRRNTKCTRLDVVCLTDNDELLSDSSASFRAVPLLRGWPGWWSKLELFRSDVFKDKESVLYFDLDTVIVGNIDNLLKLRVDFGALRPWNPRNRASGMLASGMLCWKPGLYSFLYENFDLANAPTRGGDQRYISDVMSSRQYPWVFLNDYAKIFSYKRECRRNNERPPDGAQVICFHGKPRPRDLLGTNKWVARHWK